eukprot:SAG22_NODE_1416_length_4469_cov_3.239930_5_plen_59_part_00
MAGGKISVDATMTKLEAELDADVLFELASLLSEDDAEGAAARKEMRGHVETHGNRQTL